MVFGHRTYRLLVAIFEHVVICKNLLFKLLQFLLNGTRTWVVMTGRLLVFVCVLMPGWLLMLRYYFLDPFIMKNIPYGLGAKNRNLLDVYLPYSRSSNGEKKIRKASGPVVVFLSGGAWIIGYKMWACLLARELARFGYIVVVPDYRNFPQGNIEDMIADTIAAIAWTKTHIELFGGDPERIVLSGQSAGGHIAACTVIELYKRSCYAQQPADNSSAADKIKGNPLLSSPDCNAGIRTPVSDVPDEGGSDWGLEWRTVSTAQKKGRSSSGSSSPVLSGAVPPVMAPLSIGSINSVAEDLDSSFEERSRINSDVDVHVSIDDVKMLVGISGPYNLRALQAHLHFRGLDSAIVEWICLGDVMKYSPTHAIAGLIGHTVPCQCLCQCMCSHPSFQPDAVVVNPVDTSTAVEAVAVPVGIALQNGTTQPFNRLLKGFPTVALFHGCQDMSIPASVSSELCSVLEAASHTPVLCLYKDYSHTDPILEGVLGGDCKMLHDMAKIVLERLNDHPLLAEKKIVDSKLFQHNVGEQSAGEPTVNKVLINIARFVNPF